MTRRSFFLLLLPVLIGVTRLSATVEAARWAMLNVMGRDDVADCHLLTLPGGAKILIDAGLLGDSPGAVVRKLQEAQVQSLDLAIISHFHIDHYGALLDVIDAGIPIRKVVVNVPDKAAADPKCPGAATSRTSNTPSTACDPAGSLISLPPLASASGRNGPRRAPSSRSTSSASTTASTRPSAEPT
jgi:beta-lactamase superfamily II metal-dependent hydrolase